MGGASRPVLDAHRRALRPGPHGRQRDRRSALRVHAARPRRQDPDGLLQPLRDGRPAGAARSLRGRVRQRHRRRSPRHRDADRGPHEPEPLPGRRDRLPLHPPRRLAGGRRRRQDAGVEHAHRPGRARARARGARGPRRLQVVRPRPARRQPRLRRRGERGRQLPPPRRRHVDHRQGRHHPRPARRGDHRRHRPGSRRPLRAPARAASGRRTTRASTRPPRPPRRPRSASSRPRP